MLVAAKDRFLRIVVIACLLVVLVAIVLYSVAYSCPVKHASLVNELRKYHENQDPELCEELVSKIIDLNKSCGEEEELIDCG